MSYRVAQTEGYLGNDYWQWSAWIEADDAELDRVDKVVWILHPSFKQPRVSTADRAKKFRIDSAGFGRFRLRAEIHVGNEVRAVSRMLTLTYPDDPSGSPVTPGEESARLKENLESSREEASPAPATPGPPRVFLSYASEDATKAQEIRQWIERLGANVVDVTAISAGAPLHAAVRKLIRESDAVVGFFGSDYASPGVVEELNFAMVDDKPLIALGPEMPSLPSSLASYVRRENPDDESGKAFLSSFVAKLTQD